MRNRLLLPILLPLLISLLLVSSAFAQDDTSLTRLYDTGTQWNRPTIAEKIEKPSGWAVVAEDVTTHTFTGNAVMMNDKIAVVVLKKYPSVEVYTKSEAGIRSRAQVFGANHDEPIQNIKIVENNSGAVALNISFPSAAYTLRITTGEGRLEILPAAGAKAVTVDSMIQYLVVPDFFGDDLVYNLQAFDGRALPAENMCINLLLGGDAMMMCVWQSSKQTAWLVPPHVSFKSAHAIPLTRILRIDCLPDQKIWLSFMEGKDLWRHAPKPPEKFQPPFPAKWRLNLTTGNGAAVSVNAESQLKESDNKSVESIIYPLDRVQDTPLTAVLPTDVMRNTLGVGPCQYILSVEGMKAEGDPTPNNVMEWVEKQFDDKKEKKAADDIKERLDVMTKHIAEANGRIKAYADFADAAVAKLKDDRTAGRWREIMIEMQGYAESGLNPLASPERANKLAADVIALIDKENAAAECKKLGNQLREIGSLQDHAMARCRMALRRLKQEGRVPDGAAPASVSGAEIQKQAERMLSNSSAREGSK